MSKNQDGRILLTRFRIQISCTENRIIKNKVRATKSGSVATISYDLSSMWPKLNFAGDKKSNQIQITGSNIHPHTHAQHFTSNFPGKPELVSYLLVSQSPLILVLRILTGQAKTPPGWPQSRRKKFPRVFQSHKLTFP